MGSMRPWSRPIDRSDPGEAARRQMVRRDIAGRGIRDRRVLHAMRLVPRELFLPEESADVAYEDRPLPIAAGQTISQPYVVAVMSEAAEVHQGDRVLEVGTGSGYGAAVLSQLAGEVWSVERHEQLALDARHALGRLGFDVHVVVGDGTLGLPDVAPFDAIVVTAGGPTVPAALLAQLGEGGRLVMPVGSGRGGQELVRIRRRGDRFDEEDLGAVRFVPLIGAQGFGGDAEEVGTPPRAT